jgi:hypothetical protein
MAPMKPSFARGMTTGSHLVINDQQAEYSERRDVVMLVGAPLLHTRLFRYCLSDPKRGQNASIQQRSVL